MAALNEQPLYEWALKKFGDDADSMSNEQIKAAYDKENPPEVAPDAIQNQVSLNPEDGTLDSVGKEMDDWWGSETRHPDDDALYKALTPGEKAWLKTLPNSPGLQERLQFIRMKPEDRAKAMNQMNEADVEAYSTGGQGVKGATPGAPASQAVLGDTQTTEEEKKKLPPESNTKINPKDVRKLNFGNKPSIDPKNRYKLKSIWDAYNDNEIDKSTRDYLAVDAFAKGLRGIGKDISNVGAAYTGGAIQDSTPEQSLWNKRNEEMAKSAMESEKAGVSGSREQRIYDEWAANQMMRQYNNMTAQQRIEMGNIVRSYAEAAPNDTIRLMYYDLANRLYSGNTMSSKDFLISGIGDAFKYFMSNM